MPAAISYRNHCRADTNGATDAAIGSGSASYDSAYPGTNVIGVDPRRFGRINYTTSSATVLTATADWGTNLPTRLVAALNVRLPATTVDVRIRLLNAAGSSLGDSPADTLATLVPLPGTTDRFNILALFSGEQSAARAQLRVSLPASASGHVDIGHLWAGPALVWDDGIDGQWKQLILDDSTVVRSPAGAWSVYPYPTRHGIELSRSLLTYEQALGDPNAPTAPSLRSVLREVGTSQPVIVMPRTATSHERQTLSVYGLFQPPLPEIAHQGGNRYSVGLRCW